MTKHTLLLIMVTFIGLASIIAVVYSHEQVHKVIFSKYNINSTIEIFPKPITVGESDCPTEGCVLAHNINDSLSYVLIPMFVFFVLFSVIVLIELNNLRELIELENKDEMS